MEIEVNSAYADLHGKTKIYYPFPTEELKMQVGEIFVKDVYNPKTKKKDLVVVDVGANIGMASLYFQPIAKQIYALEPSPTVYACLLKNVKKHKNIKTFNVAMSNVTGKDTMYLERTEDVPQHMSSKNQQNATEIDTITFGDFIQQNDIKDIDVLKIDVEGWEYMVFSSESFIKYAHLIGTIVGESHYTGEMRPQLISPMLKRLGFKVAFHKFKNLVFTATVGLKEDLQTYVIHEATNFLAKK